MRFKVTILALCCAFGVAYAQKPEGLSVYTWTREDIFAGMLSKDYEQLSVGMKKLDDILEQNPKDPNALAMKAAGVSVLAFRDLEKQDVAGFERQYSQTIDGLDEALRLDPQGIGVNAVYGGVMLYNINAMPEKHRARALQQAKNSYSLLYKAQEKDVDRLPLHLKGELLAGLAEVERRLGNGAEAEKFMKRIVGTMPGTAYARSAERWLQNPDAPQNSRMICQSCHDAGGLRNRGGQ